MAQLDIPPLQANYMRLLQLVQAPQLDFTELEQTVKHEATLCYRLLRYLNSSAFGFQKDVSSIRHALSLLGETEVRRWMCLVALPALVLAGIMRYLWQYSLAVLAFWTTRVEAINQLYFTLDSFMAGRIAPLALMPGWLGVIAYYSPFRGMGAFPVELFLGRVPPSEILPGFGLQLVWLAAGLVVFRALWTAGIKQYSAVGA